MSLEPAYSENTEVDNPSAGAFVAEMTTAEAGEEVSSAGDDVMDAGLHFMGAMFDL